MSGAVDDNTLLTTIQVISQQLGKILQYLQISQVSTELTAINTLLEQPFTQINVGSGAGVISLIAGEGQTVTPKLTLTGADTATSATGGAASALPAAPQAYVTITVNGTDLKFPAYAV